MGGLRCHDRSCTRLARGIQQGSEHLILGSDCLQICRVTSLGNRHLTSEFPGQVRSGQLRVRIRRTAYRTYRHTGAALDLDKVALLIPWSVDIRHIIGADVHSQCTELHARDRCRKSLDHTKNISHLTFEVQLFPAEPIPKWTQ